MALPADFSKIYGSTATGGLTPISGVNYAKGWEFVGANPPTKNDFSYLQNFSDLKSQWLYLNKLQRTNPFGDIKSDGAAAISMALENLGLGNLKYGSPLIGQLIEWPLQKMPQEIWTDCGMEFIPYMAQSFDPVKYPLLSQLHPTNVLPSDMRGYIPRGWDNGRGIDTGRVLMSAQEDAIRNITGTVSGGTDPGQQFIGDAVTATGAFSVTNVGSKYGIGTDTGWGGCQSLVLDVSKVVQTAAENRMRNVAWNMIVRAK